MNEDLTPEPDRLDGCPHPRETARLFGHDAAEQAFLTAHASGRLHHAWLLTGPKGIGKATLGWRMARFLLTQPAGEPDGLFGAPPAPETLDVDPAHPVARRIAALSEPRLFLLRRPADPKTGRLKRDITVDAARGLKGFFALSAADGGTRVVIVDAADELNPSAANAILKVLEEPPRDTVLILICHQPSRLLPTIRSRCRTMRMAPLAAPELAAAVEGTGSAPLEPADSVGLAELAGGSVGLAIRLSAAGGLELYAELIGVLGTLPKLDRGKALALSNTVAGRGKEDRFELLLTLAELALARLALCGATGQPPTEAVPAEAAVLTRLAGGPDAGRRFADAAATIFPQLRRGAAVNLDPSLLCLDMFHRLQDTAGAAQAA